MAPSRNSTLVTKPPTRARTWTSATASNRPVNSSQSVTVRLTGWATVTGGGSAGCRLRRLVPAAGQGRRRAERSTAQDCRGYRQNGNRRSRLEQNASISQSRPIPSPLRSCRDRSGGRRDALSRQDQDETGSQSVQVTAGIKHNRYALLSRFRAPVATLYRKSAIYIDLGVGDKAIDQFRASATYTRNATANIVHCATMPGVFPA